MAALIRDVSDDAVLTMKTRAAINVADNMRNTGFSMLPLSAEFRRR